MPPTASRRESISGRFARNRPLKKIVSLTFDDGPDSVQTPKVLEVLKAYQVNACFFCIGKQIKGNEKLLQQMIAEGHLIGNHSLYALGPVSSLSSLK